MKRCGCSSSASTTATGRSTCERPASSNGQIAPVAYPTLPFINRTSAPPPCSAIAPRSRAPISARMRAQFGSSGMSITEPRAGSELVTLDAQKPSDVAADHPNGALGTDGVDHGGQRPLRVAESAFVVRIVGGPHHLVDSDLVDLVEAQAVNHERGAHVRVPVVAGLVFGVMFEHVPVGGKNVLGVLQSRWDPGDSPLEPADAQPGMPVENAAEDVLG